MVFLRSRQRSSSQGELGLFSRVIPIDSVDDFFERKKPSLPKRVKKQCRELKRAAFTIGSPERDEGLKKIEKKKEDGEGFLEFLQKCNLCKKVLNGDVYMYGYLGAFCSEDCREYKMDLDGFNDEMEKEAKELAEKYAMLDNKIKSSPEASKFK